MQAGFFHVSTSLVLTRAAPTRARDSLQRSTVAGQLFPLIGSRCDFCLTVLNFCSIWSSGPAGGGRFGMSEAGRRLIVSAVVGGDIKC